MKNPNFRKAKLTTELPSTFTTSPLYLFQIPTAINPELLNNLEIKLKPNS